MTLTKCPHCCRSGIATREVDRTYDLGGRRRTVRRVPVEVCPHCGSQFLNQDALDYVDRVLGLKRPRRHRAA
jgi:YgiT-type zinc finger domain-containing protein